MSEIIGSLVKNGVVGFALALVIALMVPSIKLIVVDSLLASGAKVPIIGIRWGLPEFIVGGILGGLAARAIWQVYFAELVKRLFNIG